MLVAISLSTLLVLSIGDFATNSVLGSNQDYNKTLVLTNSKEAVSIVARQIRLARSVQSTNAIEDANAPVGGWSGAAGTGKPLILAVPSHNAATNDVVYIDGFHQSVYTDEVIFYLDSTTHKLYKRTLAATLPDGYTNAAVTTCPPASATAGCPADSDVVDDVANLTTGYLTAGSTTPCTSCSPNNTEAVNYTVTETRTINGKPYTGTYTTVAALRNR
jgi:hypothetical protein